MAEEKWFKKNKVYGILFFIRTDDDVEVEDVLKIARRTKIFGLKGEQCSPVVLREESFVDSPELKSPDEKREAILGCLRDAKRFRTEPVNVLDEEETEEEIYEEIEDEETDEAM